MSDGKLDQPGPEQGTPTWVKVFASVALVIAVIVLIALLSGGEHGPGRHSGSGAVERPAAAALLSI